ncbi:hypothetical protein WME91_51985 [Sorangium sp. So ce269]
MALVLSNSTPGTSEYVLTLVAQIDPKDQRVVQAEAAAIKANATTLVNRLGELHARLSELNNKINLRTLIARALKVASGLAALAIVFGFLSEYSRYLGATIALATFFDAVTSNHSSLVSAVKGLFERTRAE